MINRQRTLEVFGYDIDPSKKSRRSDIEFAATGGINKKNLLVVDNCPVCNEERQIQYRASSKNKSCLKCFHNLPSTIAAKQGQNKVKSEEAKRKMKENHWSTKGYESAFKGQKHTKETKQILSQKIEAFYADREYEEYGERYKKASCTMRNISIEDFNGFTASEGTRIRQSAEGKAWTYDVLVKSNFTCVKCKERGGQLHAHHLNAFNSHPDQRLDPDNGVCLCHICHEEFHRLYGKGSNTKDQFEEWLTR